MTWRPDLATLEGILEYRERLRDLESTQDTEKPEDKVPVIMMPQTLGRMLDCLIALVPQKHRLPTRPVETERGRQAQVRMPQTDTQSHPQPKSLTPGAKEPTEAGGPASPRRKRKRRH